MEPEAVIGDRERRAERFDPTRLQGRFDPVEAGHVGGKGDVVELPVLAGLDQHDLVMAAIVAAKAEQVAVALAHVHAEGGVEVRAHFQVGNSKGEMLQ